MLAIIMKSLFNALTKGPFVTMVRFFVKMQHSHLCCVRVCMQNVCVVIL